MQIVGSYNRICDNCLGNNNGRTLIDIKTDVSCITLCNKCLCKLSYILGNMTVLDLDSKGEYNDRSERLTCSD